MNNGLPGWPRNLGNYLSTQKAVVPAWSMRLRNAATPGKYHDAVLGDFTEEVSPIAGMFLYGFHADGAIRRFNVGNLPASPGSIARRAIADISGGDTITTNDKGVLVDIASGTGTLAFSPAATLANGFFCYIRNGGTGIVTLNPDGAELISGASTFLLGPGQSVIVNGDATALYIVHRYLPATPAAEFRTASATITVPPGMTKCEVTLLGGGGAGGGATTNASCGVGGSAGSKLEKYLSGLTPGNTLTLTVNAAAVGGTGAGPTGGSVVLASGTETITTLTAVGGPGGTNNLGVGTFGSIGTTAVATNGDINGTGEAGYLSKRSYDPSTITVFVSKGGNSPYGNGGMITNDVNLNTSGVAGNGFGSGGSGGNRGAASVNGGNGAPGFAIFEWYP